MSENQYPACDKCGCGGNEECGCTAVNIEVGCRLNRFGMCYCCAILGTAANVRRWTHNPNQIDIFETGEK